MTPALALQLGLLGSPPDPVGHFTMREGPSPSIVGDSCQELRVRAGLRAVREAMLLRYMASSALGVNRFVAPYTELVG